MAEQIERSAEDLAQLAVSNTAEWLKIFLTAEAKRSIDAEGGEADDEEEDEEDDDEFDDAFDDVMNDTDEWEEAAPLHGLKLYQVYSEGGHEGGGDHAEVVFAIAAPGAKRTKSPDGDTIEGALTYFRHSGYYSSYEGTEWDDISEIVTVVPREVSVIRFFKEQK